MLWTDAWIADTCHLTPAERGMYMDLLILMWRTPGCSVPNDDAWLARHLRISLEETCNHLRPLIKEFCRCNEGRITQKRLLSEYHRATVKILHQDFSKPLSDNENPDHTVTVTVPVKKERDIGAVATTTRPEIDHSFNEFKQAYPKRDGANPWTPARKVFEAAIKRGVEATAIIAGARLYAAKDREKIGTPYIAQAVTWLRQQRWTDYGAQAPPSGNGGWRPGLPTSEELRKKYAQQDDRGDDPDHASVVADGSKLRTH